MSQPDEKEESPSVEVTEEFEGHLRDELERFSAVMANTPDDLLFDALTSGAGKRDVPPGNTKMPRRWR